MNSTSFNYGNYKINIICEENSLRLEQYNTIIPFLYSDPQIINIEEEKESYDLIFKIGSYNYELLLLYISGFTNIILDECFKEGKYLQCRIYKDQLE